MTQTALTATTEVDTSLTALAAYIAAHPLAGVGVYSESAFATPTNVNEVAAGTFGTNAAMLSHYAGLTAIQTHATVVAATDAARHVFASTPSRKVKVRNGTAIYNSADGAASHFVANVVRGTILYVDAVYVKTRIQNWFKILDGTYVNDYIKVDDVDVLPHDTSV